MTKAILTQEYLNSIFEYSDGRLLWKERTLGTSINKKSMRYWNKHKKGTEYLGSRMKTGYISCCVNKRKDLMHRIIYRMHYGDFIGEIDHIDGDNTNNRIENLRNCNSRQNKLNRKQVTGKSKYKGVYWNKKDKRWRAQCTINYKHIYIGNFLTEQAAVKAYNDFVIKNSSKEDYSFLHLSEA